MKIFMKNNFLRLIKEKKVQFSYAHQSIRLLSYALIFSIILITPIGILFQDYFEYTLNEKIMTRVLFFGIAFSLLMKNFLFNSIGITDNSKVLDFKGLALTTILFLSGLFAYQQSFYGFFTKTEYLVIAIIGFLIPAIELKFSEKGLLNKEFRNKFTKIFSYTLLILALLSPFLGGNYLNSESNINFELMDKNLNGVTEKISKITPKLSNLNDSQIKLFNKNKKIFELFNRLEHYNFATIKNNQIVFSHNSTSYAELCFFLINVEASNVDQCHQVVSASKVKNALRTLIDFVYINNYSIDSVISSYYKDYRKKYLSIYKVVKDLDSGIVSDTKKNMAISQIRGGYFHHFNSIAQTINTSKNNYEFFNNQYGFGPLFIVSLTSKIFKTTLFDSIIFSTILINFLTFFFVITATKKVNFLILNGFSISILSVYMLSQMMAPFLYIIRIFPIILICLLIYKFVISNKKTLNSNYKSVLLFLVLISSLYNFEYAILLSVALITGGIFIKEKYYVLIGIISAFLSLFAKFYFVNTTDLISVNYIAYIAGLGRGDSLNIFMIIFFVAVGFLAFLLLKNRKIQNNHSFIILFIFFLMLAKIVWIGSFNHISGIFLIMAILGDLFLRSNKDINKSNIIVSNGSFLKITNLFFILILFNLSYHSLFTHMSEKINNLNYVKNSRLSNFYSIESSYSKKIENFVKIYKSGDLGISPIDNALAIRVLKVITKPYPDLSTNLNSDMDLGLALNTYLKSKSNIIIDNNIYYFDDHKNDYYNYYLSSIAFRDMSITESYFKNLDQLHQLYEMIIFSNNYYVCDKNDDFTKICRK
jgi:hypothetical protein